MAVLRRGRLPERSHKKTGRFELANKGTLFLDEVGDIPLELQAKLLRVLQEQEFERLGSNHTHEDDVRLFADSPSTFRLYASVARTFPSWFGISRRSTPGE